MLQKSDCSRDGVRARCCHSGLGSLPSAWDHAQHSTDVFYFISSWVRGGEREDSKKGLSVCSLIMLWFQIWGPVQAMKEILASLSQLVAWESFLCRKDSWPAIISIPEEELPVRRGVSSWLWHPPHWSALHTWFILWHSITGPIHRILAWSQLWALCKRGEHNSTLSSSKVAVH